MQAFEAIKLSAYDSEHYASKGYLYNTFGNDIQNLYWKKNENCLLCSKVGVSNE